MGELAIEVEWIRPLVFDDGAPVRAASGVARFGPDWLMVQDDGTHAAWRRGPSVRALRLFPPVDGLDHFSAPEGTKHLKPDLESACAFQLDGAPAVLVLGSGSTPARCRGALVVAGAEPVVHWADLTPLYHRGARALGITGAGLNFEGACVVGSVLRWFNRANARASTRSASVDVDLAALVAVLRSGVAGAEGAEVGVGGVLHYELGAVAGVALAVTDALALGDGRLLLSTAAEDSPDNIDDGPVIGTALCVVDGDRVVHRGLVPTVNGTVHKIEGLALQHLGPGTARVLAVVDADDHLLPSSEILLHLRWE